ncbi:MAG: hypothetical protein KJP07_21980 [Desulfatitalea sp.]|nr:hypothetical protein [Desulfatitalea sp.]
MSNSETKRPDGQFRLPTIKTEADLDALTHLSDEEKAYGKQVLKKIPTSDGWQIMGNDPELQALWHIMERTYTALLEGDFQGKPFGPMHLMAAKTAKKAGSDYVFGLFAVLTVRQIEAFKQPSDYSAKIGMLDNPDSGLWNEEERLILKFAEATLENKMTDELFEQARAAWGEKRLLRNVSWITFVDMWGKMSNVLGMTYSDEMYPPDVKMPPEAINAIIPFMAKTRAQVREFVGQMDDFPAGP